MNGSAKWCRDNGIKPDWQIIVDAKEESSVFVDPECECYFASQCNPKTLERATDPILVHYGLETIEEFLPKERVKKGGYALLGCGTTVGNAALSIAFVKGYKEMHLFGYDSSYSDGHSHGYDQYMNQFMPTTEITWGGKTYTASVAMKGQAEKFPMNALALKGAGCDIHVYGEGLLQTIYNTKYEDLTEKEKYQLMWNMPSYRDTSPGEYVVDTFMDVAKPEGTVIDFGCGTGRAGLRLAKTNDVTLVDFTDNCRDQEALCLPFIQADLTEVIPVKGDYGYCTDVMEHIPTEDVKYVIANIMDSTPKAFFQISTVDDHFGKYIGSTLHLTVKPHSWWKEEFESRGYKIEWESEQELASLFYITNPDRRD
jgi:SAM-dependent methyltransferase